MSEHENDCDTNDKLLSKKISDKLKKQIGDLENLATHKAGERYFQSATMLQHQAETLKYALCIISDITSSDSRLCHLQDYFDVKN